MPPFAGLQRAIISINCIRRGIHEFTSHRTGNPARTLAVEENENGHRGGIGGGYEQSSSKICHAGKSFRPAWCARSGSQPYLEGVRIGPCRTRRRRERDVLHLRGITADLPARGASDAGSPLSHSDRKVRRPPEGSQAEVAACPTFRLVVRGSWVLPPCFRILTSQNKNPGSLYPGFTSHLGAEAGLPVA